MSKETKTTEKPQDDFSAIPKNVLNLISKYATEKAIEMFNRQMEEQRAKAKDFRMKNTRLLVKKYRWLKSYAGNAVSELTQLLSEEELIFLESMGMDNLESRKVESIKDRMVFTQTVLGHIDTMLELYKNKCLNSEREEVRRRWRVLEAMYLTDNVGSPDDVVDIEHINTRTVFKDLNVAIQDLSGLFFGIDLSDIILF